MNVLEAPEMYTLIVKMVNFILCEFTSMKQKQKNCHIHNYNYVKILIYGSIREKTKWNNPKESFVRLFFLFFQTF